MMCHIGLSTKCASVIASVIASVTASVTASAIVSVIASVIASNIILLFAVGSDRADEGRAGCQGGRYIPRKVPLSEVRGG